MSFIHTPYHQQCPSQITPFLTHSLTYTHSISLSPMTSAALPHISTFDLSSFNVSGMDRSGYRALGKFNYCKCNFSVNAYVRLLVLWFVGPLVCYNSLKGKEVTISGF